MFSVSGRLASGVMVDRGSRRVSSTKLLATSRYACAENEAVLTRRLVERIRERLVAGPALCDSKSSRETHDFGLLGNSSVSWPRGCCWACCCPGLMGVLVAGWLREAKIPWIRRSVVKAVLLGVPLPLCSCGVVPAGIGLKNQGASQWGVGRVPDQYAPDRRRFDSGQRVVFRLAVCDFQNGDSAAITGVVGGWLTDQCELGAVRIPRNAIG